MRSQASFDLPSFLCLSFDVLTTIYFGDQERRKLSQPTFGSCCVRFFLSPIPIESFNIECLPILIWFLYFPRLYSCTVNTWSTVFKINPMYMIEKLYCSHMHLEEKKCLHPSCSLMCDCKKTKRFCFYFPVSQICFTRACSLYVRVLKRNRHHCRCREMYGFTWTHLSRWVAGMASGVRQ